jgi:hypothetical protein
VVVGGDEAGEVGRGRDVDPQAEKPVVAQQRPAAVLLGHDELDRGEVVEWFGGQDGRGQ